MHYKKLKQFYRMNYGAFENLVNMLTFFLKSRCVNQVSPQVEIKKIVAYVLKFIDLHMVIIQSTWQIVLGLELLPLESMLTLFVTYS